MNPDPCAFAGEGLDVFVAATEAMLTRLDTAKALQNAQYEILGTPVVFGFQVDKPAFPSAEAGGGGIKSSRLANTTQAFQGAALSLGRYATTR